jgi:hypothetical protein
MVRSCMPARAAGDSGPELLPSRRPGRAPARLREAFVPSFRLLLWMAGVSAAVVIGLQHYQARKG